MEYYVKGLCRDLPRKSKKYNSVVLFVGFHVLVMFYRAIRAPENRISSVNLFITISTQIAQDWNVIFVELSIIISQSSLIKSQKLCSSVKMTPFREYRVFRA